jgi:hypothetical protein
MNVCEVVLYDRRRRYIYIYIHHSTTHARLLSHALAAIIIPRKRMYPLNSVTGPEKQCIMFTHKIRSFNRAMNPESRVRPPKGARQVCYLLGSFRRCAYYSLDLLRSTASCRRW